MKARTVFALRVALLLHAGAGCSIGVGNFAGKICEETTDCPEPFTCVAARPGLGRTCELMHGPAVAEGPFGTPIDYCTDVRAVLQSTCVSNCHGADTTGSLGQTSFRLDQYADAPAPGRFGARTKAPQVKIRADRGDMPPLDQPGLKRLSPSEQSILSRWAMTGAQFLPDGGTATICPDGGI